MLSNKDIAFGFWSYTSLSDFKLTHFWRHQIYFEQTRGQNFYGLSYVCFVMIYEPLFSPLEFATVRILYERFFACPEAKGLFQISSTECPMQGRLRVLDINLVYIKKIKRVPRQGTNSPGWLFWKSGSSCGGQMCYMLMQNLHTVK